MSLSNFSLPSFISLPDNPYQEALPRSVELPDHSPHVEYDILLSPTYRVPVLYFLLLGFQFGPVGIETVYQYLVPDQYKSELKSIGVLGAISMGVCASGPHTHTHTQKKKKNYFKLTVRRIIQHLAFLHFSSILAILPKL